MGLFDWITAASTRSKEASPRWAREMAEGRISGAGKKLLSQMKGLKPRQIGKDPIGGGMEKQVYDAFGGDNLGAAVSKRVVNEVIPGSAKSYLEAAKRIGAPFNPTIPHTTGNGWFEPARTEVPKENIIRRAVGGSQHTEHIEDIDPALTDKLRRRIEAAGGKLTGISSPAEGINPSLSAEFPGGTMVHDLRAPNIMLDPHGEPVITDALVTQKGQRIPPVQMRKVGPGAPGLLESIRKRTKSTSPAPAAAARTSGFTTEPERTIKLPSFKSRLPKPTPPAKPAIKPMDLGR